MDHSVESARVSGETILTVKDLRIQVRTDRGDGPVLVHDVSFTLKRGEVIGLIGESGAGKSTIGLACLGYTRGGCHIVGGSLDLQGRDIRTMSAAERRALRGPGVAYIAQSAAASFNPSMTLMQQVCEIPLRQGIMSGTEARARAITLFRELDLPNPDKFGDRYPHQVSGGQLQRAMAAMAMAAKPDILVFDEPTTALDVTTQVEVLASFRKLIRESGTAAIYITHDLAVVAQIADEIMVLRHGKMVEYGTSVQILQSPREEYTRRLVADRASGHGFLAPEDAGERPVLDVENVVASYSGLVRVINDVSLSVYKGDTVAVVGESGSGKSTLARVVIGLLPRQAGDIRFNGESLSPRLGDRTRDQLRRIQMIYQMPDVALNPNQTLLEIIGRPVKFYFQQATPAGARAGARTPTDDGPAGTLHQSQARPVIRRAKAAGRHRACAGGRAGPNHLRRGHVGARPTRWRGNFEAAQAAAGRARCCLSFHHPRSWDGETHRQQGCGDAERFARRRRSDGSGIRPALPPLHGAAPDERPGDATGVVGRSVVTPDGNCRGSQVTEHVCPDGRRSPELGCARAALSYSPLCCS